MVWIGIGQETYECPKCDASGDVSKIVPSKKRSSAKKAKSKPRQSNSQSNLLVPATQMRRLVRLIDETKAILPKVSHREVFEVGLLLKSRVTYELLVNLHLHIEAEIVDVLRKTREIQTLLNNQKKDIEAAKIFKRNEGIAAWGVRRLRESAAGQPSLEAAIQYSEMQEKELREIFGKLRLSEEPLRSIEKKFREIFRTPAGGIWAKVPTLTLVQLEKVQKDELRSIPSGATSKRKNQNENKHSTSISQRFTDENQGQIHLPGLQGRTNAEKIARLYPAIANELVQYLEENNVSVARRFITTNRVWILGQMWLVFFDGKSRKLTDDVEIYEFAKMTSEREPRHSIEDQAVILMGIAASEMTRQEIEIALSIAVEKTGVTLMLNGNYNETLLLLCEHRDRVNPKMIGK
jgi:hypothetical protein